MLFVERARLGPGERLRGHVHAAGHLCLVVGGGFRERVAGRREDCDAGVLRLSRAGTEHDLAADAGGASCLVASFDDALLDELLPAGGPSLFLRAPDAAAAFRAALGAADPDRDWRTESAFHELLAQSGRSARLRRPAGPPPPWLRRVRDRLGEPGGRPELARIAAEEGVDPCHLARAFRDHFGLSASGWYRRLRVARARGRIAASGEALAAIALETGFADQAHLTREFRRECGMSPGVWRRKVRMQRPFKTASGRGGILGE